MRKKYCSECGNILKRAESVYEEEEVNGYTISLIIDEVEDFHSRYDWGAVWVTIDPEDSDVEVDTVQEVFEAIGGKYQPSYDDIPLRAGKGIEDTREFKEVIKFYNAAIDYFSKKV